MTMFKHAYFVAHLPVKRDIETCMSKIRHTGISYIYRLTDKCAAQKIKIFRSSSLWISLHHETC